MTSIKFDNRGKRLPLLHKANQAFTIHVLEGSLRAEIHVPFIPVIAAVASRTLPWEGSVNAAVTAFAKDIAAGQVDYDEVRHWIYGAVPDNRGAIPFFDTKGECSGDPKKVPYAMAEHDELEVEEIRFHEAGSKEGTFKTFRVPADFLQDSMTPLDNRNVERIDSFDVYLAPD